MPNWFVYGSQELRGRRDSLGRLQALGYRHLSAVTEGDPERLDRDFPRVHRVAALLKRWLVGTHQGAVRKAHLNSYLDEFTVRFNRRNSSSRGLLFYGLMQQAVVTPPTVHVALIASSSTYAGPEADSSG